MWRKYQITNMLIFVFCYIKTMNRKPMRWVDEIIIEIIKPIVAKAIIKRRAPQVNFRRHIYWLCINIRFKKGLFDSNLKFCGDFFFSINRASILLTLSSVILFYVFLRYNLTLAPIAYRFIGAAVHRKNFRWSCLDLK